MGVLIVMELADIGVDVAQFVTAVGSSTGLLVLQVLGVYCAFRIVQHGFDWLRRAGAVTPVGASVDTADDVQFWGDTREEADSFLREKGHLYERFNVRRAQEGGGWIVEGRIKWPKK